MKNMLMTFIRRTILFILIVLALQSLKAQGDGARNLLSGPTGVWGFIPKWMNLNQNLTPAGIQIRNADVTINAFPLTFVHNIDIGGRFAQLMFSAVPGSASGSLVSNQPNLPAPHFTSSGFADGFFGFKLGLIHQPALQVPEFLKYRPLFSMMGYFRIWYPGSYDKNNPLSLGSNRVTFEVGFPMDLQFSSDPKRPTWLEIYPALHIYTTNTNPTIDSRANESHQLPLFSIENHLSHNFADQFWAAVDVRYQYGGALDLDGVNQQNTINMLGAGVTAGYQFVSFLGANISYGRILFGDNNAKSDLFKLTAVISYVNLKKIKPSTAQ